MKAYLLVFDDGSNPDVDLQRFIESLDAGAEMYTLDGHVCFIKSNLSVDKLSDKFLAVAGSSLYFVTEVNSTDYAGRMLGLFWDFIKEPALESAAE
jgi:hypothetical protein